MEHRVSVKPFIKWAGGKSKIIPELFSRLPRDFPKKRSTYWEPFVGGGALFFALAEQLDHAVLSDINDELIMTYVVVQNRVHDLVSVLKWHQTMHEKLQDEHYYAVRDSSPTNAVEGAARFIYLNKTCYNGLYRVNKSGEFNVPMGSYRNPKICDEALLVRANELLQRAELRCGLFSDKAIVNPSLDDFVYCDPPYDNAFSSYASDGFRADDQRRLYDVACRWAESAEVMVSNSDTEFIQTVWQGREEKRREEKRREEKVDNRDEGVAGFHIDRISAPRVISAKASSRRPITELIITSYRVPRR